MDPRILLLGGTGNAGKAITRLLLTQHHHLEIVITSRTLSKATAVANKLISPNRPGQITPLELDVTDYPALVSAMNSVDLVVVASSTLKHIKNIAHAALEANIDYYDILLSSPEKLKTLRLLEPEIHRKKRVFITDGGYHPGVPAAMIRYADMVLGQLKESYVYAALRLNWSSYNFSEETMIEFAEEFKHFQPLVYLSGTWIKQRLTKISSFEFGSPYGKLICTPMYLEEIKRIPGILSTIQNAGFYISGINWLTDNLIMPIVWIGVKYLPKVFTRNLTKLLMFGMRRSKPPFGNKLVAECTGINGRQLSIHITHQDAYVLTAAPVVACLNQYLDGKLDKPGLYLQALVVNPGEFFIDLEKMGLDIVVS